MDEAINNKFIPSLFGREITDNERDIISMPVKHGGLGIRKISENADVAHEASKTITTPLVKKIVEQSTVLPSEEEVTKAKSTTIGMIKANEAAAIEETKSKQNQDIQRVLEQNSQPGASSWLGALPLQEHAFNLNKGEFIDALSLRYNIQPRNMPSTCPCGASFNVTHALNRHKGGFVNIRHDNIKNLEAKLLQMVCNDVEVEPQLQPVVSTGSYKRSANITDDARLDIRARGFWRQGQNAFFDVRVTNADSKSQKDKNLKTVLHEHEQEKKRSYNKRVMEVEHGTFTPLVFTTTGVMGHECSLYHKALAEKISNKKGERYDDVMRYMRTKISFLALKATLLCLRGSRSIVPTGDHANVGDFSLSLHELGL